MARYGMPRSPYDDEEQARAIELLKAGLQEATILDRLEKDFPSNERFYKRKLTIKVIKRWVKARPDLPETMRELGYLKKLAPVPMETVTTFEQVMLKETIRTLAYSVVHNAIVSVVEKWGISAVIS